MSIHSTPSSVRLLALAFLATGLAASLVACGGNSGSQEPGRERIFASANTIEPLFEGMPAPAFTATRPDGSAFRFDPQAMNGPAIVFFYRGGWCPYCNAQLMELRKVEDAIDDLGYEQFYLSADSPATLSEGLKGMEEIPDYEILSDNDLEAAQEFGIAFKVDDQTLARYEEYGIDLVAASGRDHQSLPVPAVFIVNADGLITFAYVNPDYRYRLHPDILLAAARASLDSRNVRERAGK